MLGKGAGLMSGEMLIGVGIVGLVGAGVLFLHALRVILPRLDFFSLRASGSRLRIPSDRVRAIFFLLIAVAIPVFAALAALGSIGLASDPTYVGSVGEIVLIALLLYPLAINKFLATAEYLLIDYDNGTVSIRPNGILGFLPFTTKLSLDEIENYRDGHSTVISASRQSGVTSSTAYTLAITGRFGARDLAFASAAVRDFAIRALAQRAA
ncbi:MAG: hypothetical protein AB7T59_04725 [Hyphomonadaceae bacterium]